MHQFAFIQVEKKMGAVACRMADRIQTGERNG